jgi:sugar phosphate isomerase/epimerase
MKLGIINSAFDQAGVDTAIGLQHIARIGFDCVDIFTEAMTITPEKKRLVLDTCRKNNLPIVSLPVVAAGLIDFNEPVRAFHVTRCKAFIDLAAEWGAKNILLHISDCDGKVHGDLPPGRGIIKFEPYLQAIKELDINGTVAIELEYSPDPSHIVEWVEEAYRQTARLPTLKDSEVSKQIRCLDTLFVYVWGFMTFHDPMGKKLSQA